MMSDPINRQDAIDALCELNGKCDEDGYMMIYRCDACDRLNELPSAQPERSFEIQDILEYLDTVLHPIVSPEHWIVYAELHDMISTLPSAETEIIRCKDCKHKPTPTENYNYDNGDCGYEINFPDNRCPCQCEDGFYNRIPDDDWFCGNAERRTDE